MRPTARQHMSHARACEGRCGDSLDRGQGIRGIGICRRDPGPKPQLSRTRRTSASLSNPTLEAMSALIVFGLSAALHFYIGARLVPGLVPPWSYAVAALVVLSAVMVPLGLRFRRQADRLTSIGLFF